MGEKRKSNQLGTLAATSICGNDITSSCLYVSALSIAYAQQYAWISLLVVGLVLYLYRKIYGEVVGAIPLNGGAYNALLNTTSKTVASIAATLTILSYMATAVISSSEAMHYLNSLVGNIPITIATVSLLGFFTITTILGLKESSRIATIIFIFHLFSLLLLAGFCLSTWIGNEEDILSNNWHMELNGSVSVALVFGFSAAMLGISGFESSANYVEEQKPGVFPKTLRNMWVLVTIINPLFAFLALAVLPLDSILDNQEALLSHLGLVGGGKWLSTLIGIDAFLVLCGAVLTSFVGVSGLIKRLSLDRVLPQILLKQNKKGSNYLIPIIFLGLCVLVLLITKGSIEALAGVYTIAFLLVMILFSMGNVLLKIRRNRLPRTEKAGWLSLSVASAAVIVAIIGNVKMNPTYFRVFLEFFVPGICLILIMLNRVFLLKVLLNLIKHLTGKIQKFSSNSDKTIHQLIDKINSQKIVFFMNDDDVALLNKAVLYVLRNEQTSNMKVVHIMSSERDSLLGLKNDISVIDREYPQLKIEFVELKDTFGPELINRLSGQWNVPINYMFIGSPGDHFPYQLKELGGVRLII